MKTLSNIILAGAMLLLGLASCTDEFFDLNRGDIPDGETELEATIGFEKFIPALDGPGTRAAGNSIEDISTLWVVIYEEQKVGAETEWVLEENGKVLITKEQNGLVIEKRDGSKGVNTGRAKFRMRHKNGTFKIFVVANYDMTYADEESIRTPERLKNLILQWDENDVRNNAEMFGFFGNDGGSAAGETVVLRPGCDMHAWLTRAASKVTVAFDASNLLSGIYIYPLEATIHNLPATCKLGADNTAVTGNLFPEGKDAAKFDNIIRYWKKGESLPAASSLSASTKGIVMKGTTPDKELHSETADALFFYENMQGVHPDKPKAQRPATSGGDGNNLAYVDKDGVPEGTYIEVKALYRSTRSDKPGYNYASSGLITYRFMLGKNVTDDYNAERNHHYKLTLIFNKYANDYDWHIDYRDPVLEVSDPKKFNYQGKVFVPDYSYPNLGNNFSSDNEVIVTSFQTDKNGNFVEPTITFSDSINGNYTATKPTWLGISEYKDAYYPFERKLTFTATAQDVSLVNITTALQSNQQKGLETAPYNLANTSEESVTPKDATIQSTANCYMVDAPGYYLLPLVYGNAFHKGHEKPESYKHTTATGSADASGGFLSVFRNYKGKEISSPYIKDDLKPTNGSAFLVWQDVNDLVHYNVWEDEKNVNQVRYLPEAYNGKGGVMFYISKANIQEGNAMIAVGDAFKNVGDNGVRGWQVRENLPEVWWSWHIWVTTMSVFEPKDRNIEVSGHDPARKFKVLPVNLGWCSGGKDIRYFPERSCWVKFQNGDRTDTIQIVQKSHIAFPMGDNTYYQWGRKDPFFAASADENTGGVPAITNKPYFYSLVVPNDKGEIVANTDNPLTLTPVNFDPDHINDGRMTSRQAILDGVLIRKPYIWHNPPLEWKNVGNIWQYVSKNEIWSNLWEGRPGLNPEANSMKTIYDPCPVGYQVPHYNFVSGTTATGGDFEGTSMQERYFNDVLKNNAFPGNPWNGVHEFYTSSEKVQSIVFPTTGYRDFAYYGGALKVGYIGYLWMSGNLNNNDDYYYSFEFARNDWEQPALGTYVRPRHTFFPCDGFPVRPVVYADH